MQNILLLITIAAAVGLSCGYVNREYKTCARVWEDPLPAKRGNQYLDIRYRVDKEHRRYVAELERPPGGGNWDNKIEALEVLDGCKLTVWQHDNRNKDKSGASHTFDATNGKVIIENLAGYEGLSKQISSLECECK